MLHIIGSYLFEFLAFGVPVCSLAFFIISLNEYKKRDENNAGLCLSAKRKLAVSSVILAIVAVVWTVMIILMLLKLEDISSRYV